MRYLLKYILFCFLILLSLQSIAQSEGKNEMRATWVATVANIDWPAPADRGDAAAQKADLISKLDLYQSINLNAIFLQVRTECDAFYSSTFEPWSRYLSINQGDDPGYDPLQFAIDEAHKRGIEVHAWMNPYRLSAKLYPSADYFHSTHIYKEHPEWAMEYETGRLLLNPGLPEVMTYIGAVVQDLCTNYAIDGVHFDDYFYAYEGTSSSLDADEFAMHGSGMTLSDWRRDNINRMIDTVYSVIQKVNSNIRFGVSPFGIYKSGTPTGIYGMDAYSQIYCDPLAWLNDQTVDYLTPQLYWPTGGAQDFETLANWWADQCFAHDRHLYTGQGTYRLPYNPGTKKSVTYQDEYLHEYKSYFDDLIVVNTDSLDLSSMEESSLKGTSDPVSEWTLSEIGLQIDIVRNRRDESGLGSVFFSAKDFQRVNGLADYLAQYKYTHPAIIPDITWKTGEIPQEPQNIRSVKRDGAYYLKWDYTGEMNDRFAVYSTIEAMDSSQIIAISENIKAIVFEDSIAFTDFDFSANSSIVVTAIAAKGAESLASQIYLLDVDFPTVNLILPANNESISLNSLLTWEGSEGGALYKLEVSVNSSFSIINYESNWISEEQAEVNILELAGETEYFWRVKSKTDIEGPWSNTRKFITAYPIHPQIIYPNNLAQNVNTTLKIKWSSSVVSTFIDVEISESSSFSTLAAEESFDAADGEGTLNTELAKATWYYIRIKSRNAFGESEYTKYNLFETTAGEIPDVTVLQPADMSDMASYDLFQWETTATTGTITYLLEISMDSDFSNIITNSGWISETQIALSQMHLEGQRDYYWHVKVKSEFGESEFSETRKFKAAYPTRPSILSPAQLSMVNDLWPEIVWDSDDVSDSIYIEISTNGNFGNIYHSESFIASPNSSSITSRLKEFSWYFIRAAAKNEYGYSIFSANKYFQTSEGNSIESEFIIDGEITIYPNPASDEDIILSIDGSSQETIKFTIFNSYGREIISSSNLKMITEDNGKFIIKNEVFKDEGLFYIKLTDGSNYMVKPIIIVK